MTRRHLVFFAVLALAAASQRVRACSCLQPPEAPEALLDADAVFTGRVVALRAPGEGSDESLASEAIEADLEVLAAWKGVATAKVTVLTEEALGTCGFDFRLHESYLVYAWGANGRFGTSLCSRTKALDAAADDIARLGTPVPPGSSPDVIRALLEDLRSDSHVRRIQACNALALKREAAATSVPALAAMLDASHETSERVSAAAALGVLADAAADAVPALAAMLADPDPEMGIAAAATLARVGPSAAPAVPKLLASLDDDAAIAALEARRERLPGGRRDELRDIERRLDAFERRRAAVIAAFGAIGPSAGRAAIDATIAQLRDEGIRPEQAEALRRMGAGVEAAAIFAGELAAHPDQEWPWLASLKALGPDAATAVPVLVARLADPERRTRSNAAEALGAIGPAASEAVTKLIEALDTRDIYEFAVVNALAEIRSPAAAPVLARAARGVSDDRRVAAAARRGLKAMGLDPDAVEPAPGQPHGRAPVPERSPARRMTDLTSTATPEAIAATPHLPFLTAFAMPGAGTCGHVAAHPDGLLGADFCDDDHPVALADIVTGKLRLLDCPDPPRDEPKVYYGSAVAVVGTTSFVAAVNFSGPAIECGAIYAFPSTGPARRIDNPFPAYEGGFGSRLAAGADYLVTTIGPSSQKPRGAILVLDATGALVSSMDDAPEGDVPRRAGLAARGDRIACALLNVMNDKSPGTVNVFDRRTGALVRTLHGPSPSDDDGFGGHIAFLDDERLLVGAHGCVHVMDVNTGAVIATARDPEAGSEESFPTALAVIDAGRFAVSGGGLGRSHAYVFDRSGALVAVARLPIEDFQAWTCQFGRHGLAVSRGRLAVGADVDASWLDAWMKAAPGAKPGLVTGLDSAFFVFGLDAKPEEAVTSPPVERMPPP